MVTKLFGIIAVAALAVSGPALAGPTKSCCYPGSECCYPGSPCCTDCCLTGAECCYPGSPCCVGTATCCELGSACCVTGAACCQLAAAAADKDDQPAKVEPKAVTLSVDGMSCAGCAKTVTKALAAVEHVESVVVDVKAKTATVTPKAGKTPSAKELWEAVEKAEYKPTKLVSPDGSFEKKPAK